MAQPPRRGCDSCHPAGKRVAADIVQPHGDTLDEERMPALSVIGQIALHLTDADRAENDCQNTLGLTKLYRLSEPVFFKDPNGNPFALMEERR